MTQPTVSAKITPLEESPRGRVLSSRNKAVGTVIALLPILLGWGGGITLIVFGFLQPEEATVLERLPWFLVGGIVLVITTLYAAWFGDYLPSLYLLGKSKAVTATRFDAVITPDEPDIVYMQVIPRAHWGKLMVENALDVGFLKLDSQRKLVLYEGDLERWSVPLASIASWNIEEFCIGPSDQSYQDAYPLVVLKINVDGKIVERPVMHRHVFFGKRGTKERRLLSAQLAQQLTELQSAR